MNKITLKEYQEKYKEKWSGIILKEICDKCNSKNLIIIDKISEEKREYPIEVLPLSKCLDCGNEMIHSHHCQECGEDTIDNCFICPKCSIQHFKIN